MKWKKSLPLLAGEKIYLGQQWTSAAPLRASSKHPYKKRKKTTSCWSVHLKSNHDEKCLTQSLLATLSQFSTKTFSKNTRELFKEIGVEPLQRSRQCLRLKIKHLPERNKKKSNKPSKLVRYMSQKLAKALIQTKHHKPTRAKWRLLLMPLMPQWFRNSGKMWGRTVKTWR